MHSTLNLKSGKGKLPALKNANPDPDNAALNNVIKLAISDGQEAIRILRKNADKWNIDPHRIGIMGFSAGAGVTMYVILNSVPEKQPNFAAPIYGGWLGDSKVPDNAPPLFIACAADDRIVSSRIIQSMESSRYFR